MLPCLTLSIIRNGSSVKWSNPRKGVTPSPTPRCSSYWKGSFSGNPWLWSPTLLTISTCKMNKSVSLLSRHTLCEGVFGKKKHSSSTTTSSLPLFESVIISCSQKSKPHFQGHYFGTVENIKKLWRINWRQRQLKMSSTVSGNEKDFVSA